MKYLIRDETLKDMADAIREKSGEQDLIQPKDYAGAIRDLSTGPEELFNITGSCSYKFTFSSWNWLINNYGDKIITKDITSLSNCFYNNSALVEIPFELNCNKECLLDSTFYYCYSLRKMPKINIDGNDITKTTYNYYGIEIFKNNYNLENIILPVIYNIDGNTTNLYLTSTFSDLGRISSFKYETNEDGTPIKAKWTNQGFNINSYFGYSQKDSNITNYSRYTGITTNTKITNSSTYKLYKNHPDRWASSASYSLYNRLSAVETINSLPDTSEFIATAGGTNRITFKGSSGSATDGGAINTMTAEEIAVATSKGWTVLFT